ncbi:hypothetical protein HPP92_028299 [Vanilla planifolia]|uniref:Uncharacterized protein n=1 Tax=Vanilla planifolia TaxID=51239 RepID=A0A835P7Y3_VANPL|nr:hypothetical protein HPP92_028299 [Vanilla planifolia]KAG0447568.1 hypothetical protein HPP92_028278 [Vanilla planifolia]
MSAPQASLLCRPSHSLHFIPPLLPVSSYYCTTVQPSFISFSLPKSLGRCLGLYPLRALSSPRPENNHLNPHLDDLSSSRGQAVELSEDRTTLAGMVGDVGSVEKAAAVEANTGFEGKRLPLLVFLVGLWDLVKRGLGRLTMLEWVSWWPFLQQEKKLERLIAEADANPSDAEKQASLLIELNNHSPESVIKRFEQRQFTVDSRGVAEYIRALVVTNAIAEYLPDKLAGKPSNLPMLLQELKERLAGNDDLPLPTPGISDKQPLHVVMVDPKASRKSTRFAHELLSTVIFTVIVGLMWRTSFILLSL